jgi:magnesium-protoporphyrin O-methyltransferase
MFKPRFARRSLKRYRTKGLDELERRMVAAASAQGLNGARVLEIGGGIGALQTELLRAGAENGEIVELVGSFEPYARELARETGLAERTSFRVVDVLDHPEAVDPADVVVMNRVVCCSPDGVALAREAARLARRTLVLSFPRDLVWLRAAVRMVNAGFRLLGSSFRVFVHAPAALVAAAEAEGMRLADGGHGALWEFAALQRAP